MGPIFCLAQQRCSRRNSVILLIPAQPVPEGRSVSLTCKLGQSAEFSSVRFYKDGQLIQEGSLRTYNFSALSKSDEGLYKCELQHSSNVVLTSPESWLSVRGEWTWD
uniref:Ig-like domain-containing protein n=1 Tax=Neogobius melanostomus TaxID=47308 RepID=A0A8C6T328_9GOBI